MSAGLCCVQGRGDLGFKTGLGFKRFRIVEFQVRQPRFRGLRLRVNRHLVIGPQNLNPARVTLRNV